MCLMHLGNIYVIAIWAFHLGLCLRLLLRLLLLMLLGLCIRHIQRAASHPEGTHLTLSIAHAQPSCPAQPLGSPQPYICTAMITQSSIAQ